MMRGKHIGFTQMKMMQMTFKESMFLKVKVAKYIEKKNLVFALLNREIIEALWGQLMGSNESE